MSLSHTLFLVIMTIPYIGFYYFYVRIEETDSMRSWNLLTFTQIINGRVFDLTHEATILPDSHGVLFTRLLILEISMECLLC